MQIPYIKPIEKVSELLDLLYNDKATAERLKLLDEAQTNINNSLERYATIMDAQVHLNAAAAALSEAQEVKAQADKYAADKQVEAASLDGEIKARRAEFNDELKDERNALAARARELNERETALIARAKELDNQENAIRETVISASRAQNKADATIAEYEQKLAKLKALAA